MYDWDLADGLGDLEYGDASSRLSPGEPEWSHVCEKSFSHTWGNSAPCNVRPSTPTYPFDHDSGELIKVTDHLSQMNAEHQRDITKYNRRGLCRCRSHEGFVQKAVNDHDKRPRTSR